MPESNALTFAFVRVFTFTESLHVHVEPRAAVFCPAVSRAVPVVVDSLGLCFSGTVLFLLHF